MIAVSNKKYYAFSKVNKSIYDYITENYANISFLSIQELSVKIGVSPASITRFAKEMGFSGYPAMQKEIQNDLKQDILPMKEIKVSIGEASDDGAVLLKTINQNIKGLQTVYNDKLRVHFSTAVDILLQAEKIYIFGMRSSYSMAYYSSFMLSQFMGNVELLESGRESLYDRLHYTSCKDVLMVVGFSRYTKLTTKVTQHFHNRQSPIIAVTDSLSSPLAAYADASLIVPNNNAYSFSSAITVLNALIIAVGGRDKEGTLEEMKQREALVLENDIYM